MPANRFEYGPTFDQVMEALWDCCRTYRMPGARVSVALIPLEDETDSEPLPLAA